MTKMTNEISVPTDAIPHILKKGRSRAQVHKKNNLETNLAIT